MKKLLSLTLAGILSVFTFSNTFALNENNYIWGSAEKISENEKENNILSINASNTFEFENNKYSAIVDKNTLIIDAVSMMPITEKDIMSNQSIYVYPDYQYRNITDRLKTVVANVPQDYSAPLVLTVEHVEVREEKFYVYTEELEMPAVIDEHTLLSRIAPYGMPVILSIPTMNEFVKGQKILASVKDNYIDKCYVIANQTPKEPKTTDEPLVIQGDMCFLVYDVNGEKYFPLKAIASDNQIGLSWDKEKFEAIVEVNGNKINLPIDEEHYLINNSTYVSKDFVERVLGLTVIEKENSFLIEK